jgi:hypothetical protein
MVDDGANEQDVADDDDDADADVDAHEVVVDDDGCRS